jgi:type II secretory pathway pseudopilin PulG
MGQQQLLLIVLGVIIVGIAVVVGINVFTASSFQANQDAVVADCTNLASMAQQYYRKPAALGGGGNTFTGWAIPAQLVTTGNGTYTAEIDAQEVIITGVGTETGDGGTVNVVMTVGPNAITDTDLTPAGGGGGEGGGE